MSDLAIRAEGLGKRYDLWTRPRPGNVTELLGLGQSTVARWLHLGRRETTRRHLWALRDVSFEVEQGSVLGLIGPNGAGKSTLLSLLARITEPTEGRAEIRGRVSSLLEVGTGFHPELSGRDNIFLNGAVLGMRRRETARKFDEIVEFSGVPDFIDTPVKRYSTGMYMRLAFSVAAHLDPDVLLVDEVLSVGDQAFQAKSLRRIEEITRSGCTVVFVSHALSAVSQLCRQGLLIQNGAVAFSGDANDAIEHYLGSRVLLHGGGLLDTVERTGTGFVRFADVSIRDADGDSTGIYANRPVVIEATLQAERPLASSDVNVDYTITAAGGWEIATLSTRFGGLAHDMLAASTRIDCVVDELPLRPGTYFLSCAVDVRGELADSVAHQIEFTVLPTDFFETGEHTDGSHSPVLVRHSWRLGEPEGRA